MFSNTAWVAELGSLIESGKHRKADGTIFIPPHIRRLSERPVVKEYVGQFLRLEAVLAPAAEANHLRRTMTRAGGDVVCDQCGLTFHDHPPDVADYPESTQGLTILCDKTRVHL